MLAALDVASGEYMPAPTPAIKRAVKKTPNVGASAVIMLPSVNTPIPANKAIRVVYRAETGARAGALIA
ncbi:hypothetical protein SALB1_0195 [Salinisphaera sp. LB1]|nr:hypothetical protein SALB1_0195 [Salinisphaera sp. LB1]